MATNLWVQCQGYSGRVGTAATYRRQLLFQRQHAFVCRDASLMRVNLLIISEARDTDFCMKVPDFAKLATNKIILKHCTGLTKPTYRSEDPQCGANSAVDPWTRNDRWREALL